MKTIEKIQQWMNVEVLVPRPVLVLMMVYIVMTVVYVIIKGGAA